MAPALIDQLKWKVEVLRCILNSGVAKNVEHMPRVPLSEEYKKWFPSR